MSDADRHRVGEHERGAAPEHDPGADRSDDRDHRREHRLDLPRLERRLNGCVADRRQVLLFLVLPAVGLHDADRLEPLLHHRDDFGLMLADVVGRLLDGLVEAGDEEEQERGRRDRDEREVPVEPEHDEQHPDDRQQVDEDAERSGRGEVLDRLHVGGDGGEERADLVGVVVAEREALQVLVDPHAQVVRDVLADALGVVVLDVAREGAERRDDDHHDPGHEGELHLVGAERDDAQPVEPFRCLVRADDVVEDDLQRPRRGQAHRRLDEHGDEDEHERPPIGPQQLADDLQLGTSGGPGGRRGRPGDGGCGGGFGGHGKAATLG